MWHGIRTGPSDQKNKARSQSYDRVLQRQRCKFLQRAFWKQIYVSNEYMYSYGLNTLIQTIASRKRNSVFKQALAFLVLELPSTNSSSIF
jgi:hypothetical protein